MNITDITITSLETITAFDINTGEYLFTVDELQNANIANTQESVPILGKGGRKLNSLKRNKAAIVTGTNGLVSSGLLGVQTGSQATKETAAPILWTDYVTIKDDAATTEFKAVGAAGSEILEIAVKNSDGVIIEKLTQDATAGDGTFAYAPATKKLTFKTSSYEDGTEINVYYMRNVAASVVTNVSDVYSKKAMLYIDAFGEDSCTNVYRVQFYIPKADFSGNFDLAMGDNQTVHAFEAESLAGGCGLAGGLLWSYTVFGSNAADAS